MKTYKAVCLEDKVLSYGTDSFTLSRGKEYIISMPGKDDTVTVFSTSWVSGVPANIFGGFLPGPGDPHN
jgi:hypothetical protein